MPVLTLGTCGAVPVVLLKSTVSLKTSYFYRESTFRVAWLARGHEVLTYSLIKVKVKSEVGLEHTSLSKLIS